MSSSDANVVWKTVPGYRQYEASSSGNVRLIETGELIETRERPTSKGTYLNVKIVDDYGNITSRGIHRFICAAFNGLPPRIFGNVPLVNHKDGNKHNNRPENLEWANHSTNLYHAVEEGLRGDTIRITVVDHLEETRKDYAAMSVVARFFSENPAVMNKIISKHTDVKWNDRYTFIKDDSGFKGKNRNDRKYIKLKDYRSGEIYFTESASGAMDLSRVNAETILYRLSRRDITLLCGHVFMNAGDDREFPQYDGTEVQASIDAYQNRPTSRKKRYGVSGKNYATGQVVEWEGIRAAERALGLGRGMVRYLANADKFRLYKGWYFQYNEELTEWPSFSQEYAEVSLRINKPEFPPVYVKDLLSGTTKLHASIKEFAEENGLWSTNVSAHLKAKGTVPYKGRWVFTYYEF